MFEENMNEVTMEDGTVYKIDPKLNLKKLLMINRDFNTDDFAKMSVTNQSNMDISVMQGAQAVYVAYRQANMVDYLSFNEFISDWEFDLGFATQVYSLMMFKKAREEYQKAFEKADKTKK